LVSADILIKDAMILTMDENGTIHEKADLAVTGAKISSISQGRAVSARKTIDARNMAVMPGLINTHTHAAMTLLRGVADDLPLGIWLQKYMFPLEKQFCDREFVRAGMELAAVEMIRSGTTSFADMFYFEDEAAQACKRIGIRAFLGEALLDFPTPDSKTSDDCLKLIEEMHKKYGNDPIIHLMVDPHSVYTCSLPVFEKAKALADRLDIPLQIHLSETAGEVEQTRSKYGVSPVRLLEQAGFLSDRVIAVHCVHLDREDIGILKKHDVKVSHCQESNMKLASGDAPIVELLREGVSVGLGTDGAASNNNLDIFDEMGSVAKYHKAVRKDPAVMDATTVLRMATSMGAKVVQRPDIGSLEEGKTADIILVSLDSPNMVPLYNIYSNLVYSAGGSEVDTVIINGRIVMEKKQLLTADETRIIREAREFSDKIRRAL
jgi:5-methylthioadenosine/S-adenosylhomocysteine deaminase